MKLAAFDAVAKALNAAEVRYLVAGGLAVNAHGYLRLTMDIDLVIALDPASIERAFSALAAIGYHPNVPIDAKSFAQPENRKRWQEEKGMKVLNFFSDKFPTTSVDVFIYEPFDFDEEYKSAFKDQLLPGLEVRFVSIPSLIRMKQAANRQKDIDDIQHLRWIQQDEGCDE
ncbi:MAG: hypothetical protein Tsb0027_16300 [Wenzhouxiangellaceae bacterium]